MLTAFVSFTVTALFDSGSAGNFISGTLCQKLKLKKEPCISDYFIQSIISKPLERGVIKYFVGSLQLQVDSQYIKFVTLLFLERFTADEILGRPWCVWPNPVISWSNGMQPVSRSCLYQSVYIHQCCLYVPLPLKVLWTNSQWLFLHVMPPSAMSSARDHPPSHHLINHGTVPLTWFLVNQCPVERFIHYPSQNRKPWRSMGLRSSNRATSIHPLLLLVFFFFMAKKDKGLTFSASLTYLALTT